MNVWGMQESRRTKARINSQDQGGGFDRSAFIRPPVSGTSSPIVGSPLKPRRNSAPDASAGSHDLRKALAVLALNQDNSNNDQLPLPSPSGSSLHNFCPDTPRSSDEKNSHTQCKTPETPITPAGYILSSVEQAVIDCPLRKQSLEDGSVVERIRVFPREMFSGDKNEDVQDYGTITLKVDPTTNTCIVYHIGLNEALGMSEERRSSIKRDLELRGADLAAERQKELREENEENI
jgi:hypothetical protein